MWFRGSELVKEKQQQVSDETETEMYPLPGNVCISDLGGKALGLNGREKLDIRRTVDDGSLADWQPNHVSEYQKRVHNPPTAREGHSLSDVWGARKSSTTGGGKMGWLSLVCEVPTGGDFQSEIWLILPKQPPHPTLPLHQFNCGLPQRRCLKGFHTDHKGKLCGD